MQNLPLHVYSAFRNADDPEVLLRGFQKFLSASYQPKRTPYKELSSVGGSRLFFYQSQGRAKRSVFLVPSLINGSEIFDLTETNSFIRYLLEQGTNVYLINWGNLHDDFHGGLKELFLERMSVFWKAAWTHSNAKPHVLGYCLGGTLCATFFATESPKQPASITFLATPFDFNVADAPWYYVLSNDNQIKTQIRLQDALTQRMLQSHFVHIQPEYTVQKFERFLDMQEGSEAEKCFIAVERWLNEGADIPFKLSMDIIDTYFLQNTSLKALKKLPHIPVTYISSINDQIVPEKSASAISKLCPLAKHIETNCGHVGMMAGRKAKQTVWQPFIQFLETAAMQQT